MEIIRGTRSNRALKDNKDGKPKENKIGRKKRLHEQVIGYTEDITDIKIMVLVMEQSFKERNRIANY